MLSFHLVNSGRSIEIRCDQDGIAILTEAFAKIQPTGGHVHLLTPSNGGHELWEPTKHDDDVIGEVIMTWWGE